MSRNDYIKLLIKKFVFHIHPDYFHNHKKLQYINESNLKVLNSLNDTLQYSFRQGHVQENGNLPRSLIFYLKPNHFTVGKLSSSSYPRKVSIPLQRLEESLLEILDTLGVSVTERPTGAFSSGREDLTYSHCVSATPRQILAFLNSLTDRRNLIQWRQDRKKMLYEYIQNIMQLTGACGVEFHTSWSAQNNMVLLSTILQMIESSRSQLLSLPWNGLKLIISTDETQFNLPYGYIDYDERNVYINPTYTPSQWIIALSRDRSSTSLLYQQHHDARIEMKNLFERYLTQEIKKLTNKVVEIEIAKGFTCSELGYHNFLSGIALEVKQHLGASIANDNVEPSGSTRPGQVRSTTHRLRFIVEDSHGTKILPDGAIRLDSSKLNSLAVIHAIILQKSSILSALTQSEEARQKEAHVAQLMTAIRGKLELEKITYGAGVDEEKMETCLQSLSTYMARRNGSRGSLKELRGMNLVVGHYLGIADDGSCILPWDLQLP
eukprot:gene26070-34675_t